MKSVIEWLLSHACALIRHAGGCWLLNREGNFFYDEIEDTYDLTLASPTYRLWVWATGTGS